MLLIIPAVLLISLMLAFNLPVLYESARLAAAESAETPQTARVRPFLAATLLLGGVVPAWLLTREPAFCVFVLLLACAAYIDWITQWVPDPLNFMLSWAALGALLPGEADALIIFAGAAAMLLPAVLLNVITWLRAQPPALASGDLYVLPALGAWLTPEWAGLSFLASLFFTAIVGRFIRGVPFITVLYPVFMMGMLCRNW